MPEITLALATSASGAATPVKKTLLGLDFVDSVVVDVDAQTVTSNVAANAHEVACKCAKKAGVCPCGDKCKCATKAMVAALKQIGYEAKEASCCGKALKTAAGACTCGPDCQCGPECACAACPGKTCGKACVACPARALGTCTCGETCRCGPDCSCAACPAKKERQRETLNKLAVGGAIFAAGFLAAKVLRV